jgi:hypothetical protein
MTETATPPQTEFWDAKSLHPLLANTQTFTPDGGRMQGRVAGFNSSQKPTAYALIEAALDTHASMEQLDERTVPVEHAHELGTLRFLLEAALQELPKVMAWCVVTTYDPNGSFAPGRDVIWSAHFTQEDAELWLPAWDGYLKRPLDNIRVEQRPAELQYLRQQGHAPVTPR